MRAWKIGCSLGMVAMLGGWAVSSCASERSLGGVFADAMADELAGPPSDDSLKQRSRFAKAGVSFEYPSPLRMTVDHGVYTDWSLARGDFELELHLPDGEMTVDLFLDELVKAMTLGKGDIEGPLQGHRVDWCGRHVIGVVYRFEFMGDPQIVEGFDLPGTRSGSRYLVFSDMRVGDGWSKTAQATFEAVDDTIRCDVAGKTPKRSSAD